MARHRGKALGFIGLVVAGWIAARIVPVTNNGVETAHATNRDPVPRAQPQSNAHIAAHLPELGIAQTTPRFALRSLGGRSTHHRLIAPFTPSLAVRPWTAGDPPSGFQPPPWVAAAENSLSASEATLPSRALALEGKVGSGGSFAPAATAAPAATPATQRRYSLYGYSFWRAGSGSAALAPEGQYGGSQSALIAGYDLAGAVDRGLALFTRFSITPDGNEKEAAFGLRWQRIAGSPVMLAAERRVRLGGPDRFAAFAAAGVDDKPLPAGFALYAYGQAGWVSGKDGGDFFDAQTRVTHALPSPQPAPLRGGIGAWAGGQSESYRLDIGPTLTTKIDTGLANFDLRLDWRQRVAGKVEPGSGLALTVSTGF